MVRFITLGGVLALAACGQSGVRGVSLDIFTSGSVQEPRPGPLSAVAGVSDQAVEACRQAIAAAATRHGATQVEAVSAGTPSQLPEGVTEAPLETRIVYTQADTVQVRQARIACRLDDRGNVLGLV
jgi:hypothetical protein